MAKQNVARSDFYVYILFRPDSGEPFYVGKGRRARWSQHERDVVAGRSHKDNIIYAAQLKGLSVPRVKIRTGLTNQQAADLEIEFIEAIGRKPNGPLVNITRGGEGAADPTEEQIAKKRSFMQEKWKDPVYQSKVKKGIQNFRPSQEWLEAKSQALSASQIGKKRPTVGILLKLHRTGVPLSQSHRDAIGRGNTGKILTDERRKKISDALIGKRRGPHDASHNAKISQALRGKPKSESHRLAAQTGRQRWAERNRAKKLSLLMPAIDLFERE